MEKSFIPPTTPGRWPCIIGIVIFAQFLFLPLANFLEFVPLQRSPGDINPPIESTQNWGRFTQNDTLQNSADSLGNILAGWGEITGMDQGWDMFTPAFPAYTVVPCVDLTFADAHTERSLSRFDPIYHNRFRLPIRHDREFNYEANVFMLVWHMNPYTLQQNREESILYTQKVRENGDLLYQYIVWHARKYRGTEKPISATLILKYLPIARPGEAVPDRDLIEIPFARRALNQPYQRLLLPIEGYDPHSQRFVILRNWIEP